MMDTIKSEDIGRTFETLGFCAPEHVEYDNEHATNKYPHGVFIFGEGSGLELIPELTETLWNNYQWNPPVHGHEDPEGTFELDDEAPPKPTWEKLMLAYKSFKIPADRLFRVEELRFQCSRRISLAYGENSFEEEVKTRLNNDHTAEEDAERERLRARYAEIKAWILANDDLDRVDIYDDTVWEEGWSPPD